MAIEAVIWDFGGVFTSSPFEAFNRLEAEMGAPKDHIRRVNATNHHENAWALFERNEIDTARFDQLFLEESTALGFAIRGADVLPKLSGELRPRMVAALKTCKARFKVGCITNNVVSMHSPGQNGSARRSSPTGGPRTPRTSWRRSTTPWRRGSPTRSASASAAGATAAC